MYYLPVSFFLSSDMDTVTVNTPNNSTESQTLYHQDGTSHHYTHGHKNAIDFSNLPIRTRLKQSATLNESGQCASTSADIRASRSSLLSDGRLPNFFCFKCGYWRNHDIPLTDHKSCICSLLSESSICCVEGYSCLLRNIPSLIYWSPIPNKYISDILELSRSGHTKIRLEKEKTLNLIRAVTDVRAEILQHTTSSVWSYPTEIILNRDG